MFRKWCEGEAHRFKTKQNGVATCLPPIIALFDKGYIEL